MKSKNNPGIKTTEFWLSTVGVVGTIASSMLGIPLPMETIMGVSGTIISYVLGRTYVKKKS